MRRLCILFVATITLIAGAASAATFNVTTNIGGSLDNMMWDPLAVSVNATLGDDDKPAQGTSQIFTQAIDENLVQQSDLLVDFTVEHAGVSLTLSGLVRQKYKSKIDDAGGSGCYCYTGSAKLMDRLDFVFASGTFSILADNIARANLLTPFHPDSANSPAEHSAYARISYSYTAAAAPAPVPLPAPGLLLAGVLGLGVLSRRRR